MQFSPATLETIIVEPLRDFFKAYGDSVNLKWDEDEKKSNLIIGSINDFHRIQIGEIPRILVDRGVYQVNRTGITNSLAEGKSYRETKGLEEAKHMVMYSGNISIIIESKQRGSCELITDMVSHFLIWTRPVLEDALGFKEFGMPLQVSNCQMDREDTTKLRVSISIPYIKEEHWEMNQRGVTLKGFIIKMAQKFE